MTSTSDVPEWTRIFDQAERIPVLVAHYGPTTALATGLAVLAFKIARATVQRWQRQRFARDARLITVSVPPQVDPASAPAWWAHQTGLLAPAWKRWIFGQPYVAFEYIASAAGVRVQIWVPGQVPPGMVEETIRAAWPGATTTTRASAPPIPPSIPAAGGRLVLSREDSYPLKTDHHADPIRSLLGAVSGLDQGQCAAVQILARPVTGRRLTRAHRVASRLKGGNPATSRGFFFDLLTPGTRTGHPSYPTGAAHASVHPERAEQVRAILAKATQPRFEADIRYAVATPDTTNADKWLRGRAHALASVAALFASGHQHLRRRRLRDPALSLAERRLGRGYLLGAAELAALAHLPLDADAPAITRAGARPVAPSPDVPTGPDTEHGAARVLGDADAGHPRPVAMPVVGARQHVHVLGQTGVGKSTLLASLILGDAREGRGALVIDPKGDLIADVLNRLPSRMAGRTVVFDPSDPAPPPSVGILSGPDPAFAVDSVVSIFHRCFRSSWGPRLDDLLRSACLSLMRAHGARATLAQVPQLLTDSAFRARVVGRLSDDLLRGFWAGYDELSPAGRAAAIGPVMNKLRAVLLRPFVHQALSATGSTVDLARHLDHGGLVLARLPKGVLGEDAARLMGSLLLAHTWQGVTRRTDLPEHERPDSAAYIDECHNFLNLPGSVSDILAEARGYRLSLVLAHQHLSQLPKDLRDAVSADARNKIYFAASPEDASDLARHAGPVLSAHDLAHLGAYQAAGRLVTAGQPTQAFTFRTRPLRDPIPGRADHIRAASRQRFAPRMTTTKPTTRKGGPPSDPRAESPTTEGNQPQ
ncbi:type IV secretory system conjugative DNA transfer family protein [Actinomadura sp. GTD37]|uniref:type IV secretory system conjugative DNA transfer family protein n=1 Tax=Actinomadura sp. GTD37 TaxID=1778030 RepID=UPI0035BEDEA6